MQNRITKAMNNVRKREISWAPSDCPHSAIVPIFGPADNWRGHELRKVFREPERWLPIRGIFMGQSGGAALLDLRPCTHFKGGRRLAEGFRPKDVDRNKQTHRETEHEPCCGPSSPDVAMTPVVERPGGDSQHARPCQRRQEAP